MRRERQTNQAENRAYLRKVQIIGFKELKPAPGDDRQEPVMAQFPSKHLELQSFHQKNVLEEGTNKYAIS